jgi:aspartyl-tRNA(Asn)/glutamyl-tRNA(Gln) amidotransferase subunit A
MLTEADWTLLMPSNLPQTPVPERDPAIPLTVYFQKRAWPLDLVGSGAPRSRRFPAGTSIATISQPQFHARRKLSMADDIAFLTATELLARYAAKDLSPVEATHAALAQIGRHNNSVNAFCLVDEDRALAAARESEARWMRKEPRGLADGVPCSVKDLLVTKGWPTLRGSLSIARDQPWDENAPAVDRLLENGAVLLGKTTTPEFGWKGVTDSPLTGITRNPWDLSKTSGGSSGGAAVAAALGMGALHIGTDGGGSIRIPSSFTGIFGLKPTHGRVPAYPPSPFSEVAHIGPMTRSIEDAALMLQIMAQPDRRDWQAVTTGAPDYRSGLTDGVRGLRIGYSADLGFAKVDPEIAKFVSDACKKLEGMGAMIVPADLDLSGARQAFRAYWCGGLSLLVSKFDPELREKVDPALLKAAGFGASLSLADYLGLMSERAPICHALSTAFGNYDLLVTPATPIPAFTAGQECPAAGDWDWMSWTPFTYPFNMSQQPAAAVPIGLTQAGLPASLQIVGPRLADALVLRAAFALQEAFPFAVPPMA